jgi:hypothetical protein
MTQDEIDKLRSEHYQDEVDNLSDSEKFACWNQYCDEANYPDDRVYDNDEEFFANHFSDVMEAVRAVCFGEYRYQDEWVVFNGCGNLDSSNDIDSLISLSDMTSYIEDNPSDFSDWIEEFEEPEEEDDEDDDDESDDEEESDQ